MLQYNIIIRLIRNLSTILFELNKSLLLFKYSRYLNIKIIQNTLCKIVCGFDFLRIFGY